MAIVKTFKTKVYLNEYAKNYCTSAFGVDRHARNWAIAKCFEIKKATNVLPTNFDLDKIYRQELKAQGDKGFEWVAKQLTSPALMQEVMKDVKHSFAQCREEQRDFDRRRWAKLHKKPKRKPKKKHPNRYKTIKPKFKKRTDPKQSFRYAITLDRIAHVESDHVFSLQTATKGKRAYFRTAESLAFLRKAGIKLCTVTVKREAGIYWLIISYERPNRMKLMSQPLPKIGIDLGVVKSAVSFDGSKVMEFSFNTKNSLKKERQAKRLNHQMSHCKYGSNKYNALRELYVKRMATAKRQREAALEECTAFIARTYKEVVVDTFQFEAAKLVSDNETLYHAMSYQFKLRLQQKVEEAGGIYREIQHAKGIKTTHRCSVCGSEAVSIDDNTRILSCRCCHTTMDRDENAARNCFNL